MTLSGTYTEGFTNNGAFRLRIAWSATQNVNENYSRVTAHLYIDSLQSWASVYDGTSSPCSISINGNTKSFSNTSTVDGWGTKWLGSHTVNVYHNNDGSKWFDIYATHNFDITWNGSYVGTVDVYGSDWLNTIPRASVPTITTTGIKYGDNIHVNLNRASEDFTHYVSIDIGDVLTNIGEMDEYTNAFDFVLPLDWCSRIPNMSSNMGKFNVHTYNGDGTYIGSNEVWFTAAVPASVVPTIDTVSIAEAVAGLAAKFGVFVQSKSKLTLGATGSGIYGSTISAYKVTANGVTYNTQNASTDELVNSGNQNVVFTVTDSRGRTASRTEAINVVSYAAPSTASIAAERALVTGEPDDDGTYANVSVVGTIAPVNNLNDKTYTIRQRKVGTETWTETVLDNTSYNLALTPIVAGFDVDFAYEIELVIADYFSSDAIQTDLSTAFTLVDYYNGGKGIAFGKVANKNGFEDHLLTWFTGGIEAVELPVGDGSLAYWQTVLGGYYFAALGSVTGQPSPAGLVQVIRQGTDFAVMWHDTASRNIYRLNGSALVLNGWTMVHGDPVTFIPTLLNGWSNYDGGFSTVEFYKDSDGVVHITGLITGGGISDGTIIFTLPVGYRPRLKEIFTVNANNAFGRVDVNDNGNVIVKVVSDIYTSLSGISFLAIN